MNTETYTFNPIDYGFKWVNGWYEFDYEQARKDAMAARRMKAKEMRKAGYNVRMSTISNQRITMGGIGSGYPEIHQIVSVYRIVATFDYSRFI